MHGHVMKLFAFEERWADHVGTALLPPEAIGGARRGADLGQALGRLITAAPWWTAGFLRVGLWLVWLSPLYCTHTCAGAAAPRGARLQTFGGLDLSEQEAMWERLLEHPLYALREAAGILKLFLCMAFLGDHAALRAIGAYDLRRAKGGGA